MEHKVNACIPYKTQLGVIWVVKHAAKTLELITKDRSVK
jgi:hypothetical protein